MLLKERFCRKKSNLPEWLKLPEGYFNKCVFTVASLHTVDEEPVAVRGQCVVIGLWLMDK